MKRIPVEYARPRQSPLRATPAPSLARPARTPAQAADNGRQGRARQVPGHDVRLPRLPHAVEDGRQGPRARHEPHAVGPSRGAGMPPAPKLPRARGS